MEAKMIPYLEFENAKEALAYYQQVFGATNVYRVSPTADEAEQYGLNADVELSQLTMRGGLSIIRVRRAMCRRLHGSTHVLDVDFTDVAG